MKNVIWILVLSFVMVGCNGKGNQEESGVAFKTLIVTKSNLQLSQDYPASIEGRQSIKIIPRIEGYLQNVHIKEGQCVKRGQTLFTIDQTLYKAEVTAAEANVAVAEANVAEAVQKSVLAPLEQAINGVDNMTYMTSSVSNGSASISIYFKQGTNPDML